MVLILIFKIDDNKSRIHSNIKTKRARNWSRCTKIGYDARLLTTGDGTCGRHVLLTVQMGHFFGDWCIYSRRIRYIYFTSRAVSLWPAVFGFIEVCGVLLKRAMGCDWAKNKFQQRLLHLLSQRVYIRSTGHNSSKFGWEIRPVCRI